MKLLLILFFAITSCTTTTSVGRTNNKVPYVDTGPGGDSTIFDDLPIERAVYDAFLDQAEERVGNRNIIQDTSRIYYSRSFGGAIRSITRGTIMPLTPFEANNTNDRVEKLYLNVDVNGNIVSAVKLTASTMRGTYTTRAGATVTVDNEEAQLGAVEIAAITPMPAPQQIFQGSTGRVFTISEGFKYYIVPVSRVRNNFRSTIKTSPKINRPSPFLTGADGWDRPSVAGFNQPILLKIEDQNVQWIDLDAPGEVIRTRDEPRADGTIPIREFSLRER